MAFVPSTLRRIGLRFRRRGFSSICLPSAIRVSEEVARALASNQAVVALESTIVAHGMPWPRNLEAATQVETLIREHGAVPATVRLADFTSSSC